MNKHEPEKRSALKKTATLTQFMPARGARDEEAVMKSLLKLSVLRRAPGKGKQREESIGTITTLLNSPVLSHSSIVRELKCLMSNSNSHESYLISKGLAVRGKAMLQ